MSNREGLRAYHLALLLNEIAFDSEDAAAYLGINVKSLWEACRESRIPYVQMKSFKLFTLADLKFYAARRGRGRTSRLNRVKHYEVGSAQRGSSEAPGGPTAQGGTRDEG